MSSHLKCLGTQIIIFFLAGQPSGSVGSSCSFMFVVEICGQKTEGEKQITYFVIKHK